MIALDSSVWIARWQDAAVDALIVRAAGGGDDSPGRLVVPATVVFETRRWLLQNVDDEDLVDTISAQLEDHDVVAIDASLANYAALTAVTTGLAAADAMILAAARRRRARLLTFDRDFAGIPDVVVLERA